MQNLVHEISGLFPDWECSCLHCKPASPLIRGTFCELDWTAWYYQRYPYRPRLLLYRKIFSKIATVLGRRWTVALAKRWVRGGRLWVS